MRSTILECNSYKHRKSFGFTQMACLWDNVSKQTASTTGSELHMTAGETQKQVGIVERHIEILKEMLRF